MSARSGSGSRPSSSQASQHDSDSGSSTDAEDGDGGASSAPPSASSGGGALGTRQSQHTVHTRGGSDGPASLREAVQSMSVPQALEAKRRWFEGLAGPGFSRIYPPHDPLDAELMTILKKRIKAKALSAAMDSASLQGVSGGGTAEYDCLPGQGPTLPTKPSGVTAALDALYDEFQEAATDAFASGTGTSSARGWGGGSLGNSMLRHRLMALKSAFDKGGEDGGTGGGSGDAAKPPLTFRTHAGGGAEQPAWAQPMGPSRAGSGRGVSPRGSRGGPQRPRAYITGAGPRSPYLQRPSSASPPSHPSPRAGPVQQETQPGLHRPHSSLQHGSSDGLRGASETRHGSQPASGSMVGGGAGGGDRRKARQAKRAHIHDWAKQRSAASRGVALAPRTVHLGVQLGGGLSLGFEGGAIEQQQPPHNATAIRGGGGNAVRQLRSRSSRGF